MFCFAFLKLEVLKLIPLYYFMLKIKEIVVYFLGENIWKWRLQSHIDSESFAEFDVFMDKTIQYLASSSSKKSIGCLSRKFYNSGDAIEITASILKKL
jgi:hypothetical protein